MILAATRLSYISKYSKIRRAIVNWTKRGHLCVSLPDNRLPNDLLIYNDVETNPGPRVRYLNWSRSLVG